jgi:hypothetical protein
MRIPYFYIIRHKFSNRRYAGSKWSIGSDPSNFFKEKGYFTSSKLIHNIIKEEGIDAFDVEEIIREEEIKIPFGWSNIFEYETWFLESNNCAKDDKWLNQHNNSKHFRNKGIAWNKGLSKESDERILSATNKYIENRKENYWAPWNKGLNKDSDERILSAAKKQSKIMTGRKVWNDGLVGAYSEEYLDKLRKSGFKRYTENNPMLDPLKRKQVSDSKRGRKRIYREDGTYYLSPRLDK